MDSETLVLIVEDDKATRELMAQNLSDKGYRVAEAVSGEEGIATLDSITPQLVILDLVLPGIAGDDLIRAVRSRKPSLPILVVSVLEPEEISEEVNGYVVKPFTADEFERNVRRLAGEPTTAR